MPSRRALLTTQVPVTSVISAASGAQADRHVTGGEEIFWAGGTRKLTVLGTPGHTKGCVSYHDDSLGLVLTGDALFINGCGRTDFQARSTYLVSGASVALSLCMPHCASAAPVSPSVSLLV